MSLVESELPIQDQIKTVMSHYPDWAFVREVLDPLYTPKPDDLSDIVTRGVFRRILFPGVDLFFATVKPTFDEREINILSEIPVTDIRNLAQDSKHFNYEGAHSYFEMYEGYYWGKLSFTETLGHLEQSLLNTIIPVNPLASKILEQYGLREGNEQSQSELSRNICVHFMPSVPLAEFIATSWEMYSISDEEKQQFRVLPDAWGRRYAIPLEDIRGIIHDESYLQKIADKTLEGYIVPSPT